MAAHGTKKPSTFRFSKSSIHDMPAFQPVSAYTLEATLSMAEVSYGARQSPPFPHRLGTDSRLCSGFAISTLETLILGLAA